MKTPSPDDMHLCHWGFSHWCEAAADPCKLELVHVAQQQNLPPSPPVPTSSHQFLLASPWGSKCSGKWAQNGRRLFVSSGERLPSSAKLRLLLLIGRKLMDWEAKEALLVLRLASKTADAADCSCSHLKAPDASRRSFRWLSVVVVTFKHWFSKLQWGKYSGLPPFFSTVCSGLRRRKWCLTSGQRGSDFHGPLFVSRPH